MTKVILKGYIEVPPEDLSAVQHALPEHIELTRAEPGCLVFNVEADPEYPNRFHVYEEFCDAQVFAAHQERVQNSSWGHVSANVERHYQVSGAAIS